MGGSWPKGGVRGEGGGGLTEKGEGENKEEERCWDRVLRNSGTEGSLDGADVGCQRVVEE